MTIIIEGPDNAGKTMLGQALSERWEIPLVHSVRPEASWNEEDILRHSVFQLRPQGAILDRVYAISEYIYGRIIRGKSDLGDRHYEALLDLYDRNLLIIYCRPSDKTILDNGERDQMDGVLAHHSQIIEEYDYVMREVAMFGKSRVVRYNWEQDVVGTLDPAIKSHLDHQQTARVSSAFMTQFRDKELSCINE